MSSPDLPKVDSHLDAADETVELTVTDADTSQRLDRFLAGALEDREVPPSRSRIHALISQGRLSRVLPEVEHKISDRSYRVKLDEVYALVIPAPLPATPIAQDIPIDILYEDDILIVVNKAAGMVVHPAPGALDGTLVNALLFHCGDSFQGIGGVQRPGIVHRLDKETSGVMVVAKTEPALHHLQLQFAAHGRDGRLERAYTALAWGEIQPPKGSIDAPIARSPHNRRKMAVRKTGGRDSITHFEVRKSFGTPIIVSRVECHLETGRTHQIRVHLTHMGHPLLGDQTYGGSQKTRHNKLSEGAQSALATLNRQALHAHKLGFDHPKTGEHMVFSQELPEDMANLIAELTLM